MAIVINGYEIEDAEVERELPQHQDAANPLQRTVTLLALRRILLDEAQRLGLSTEMQEQEVIDALLASEVKIPVPDETVCRRHYEQNPQQFTVGELVEVDHILFQVTQRVPLEALRALAQQTLQELLMNPSLFAERARSLSNCSSGAVGGSLGQIGRGDTVAEFERAVFALRAGEMLPRLLETRFGLHIVRVAHHIEGRVLPFEFVKENIAQALQSASRDAAWRQYLQLLVGRAKVEGVNLEGAGSLLVQ